MSTQVNLATSHCSHKMQLATKPHHCFHCKLTTSQAHSCQPKKEGEWCQRTSLKCTQSPQRPLAHLVKSPDQHTHTRHYWYWFGIQAVLVSIRGISGFCTWPTPWSLSNEEEPSYATAVANILTWAKATLWLHSGWTVTMARNSVELPSLSHIPHPST